MSALLNTFPFVIGPTRPGNARALGSRKTRRRLLSHDDGRPTPDLPCVRPPCSAEINLLQLNDNCRVGRRDQLLPDAPQIETLQRRKQRALVVFIATGFALLLACMLRLIPGLNDFLAGRPQYAKALTTLMAQEFGKVAQGRFPVLLRGEDDSCNPVPPVEIADDKIAGILYILTYSEKNRFSCMSSFAVPVDPSKFANLQTLQPGAEWAAGPSIDRPIKAIPVARNLHIYPAAYLESLHWRMTPRFPISANEAASLAPKHYESRNPTVPPDAHANIDIDFDKARALVRQPHDKTNFGLSLALTCFGFVLLYCALLLIYLYRQSSRYLRVYGESLAFSDFLRQDMTQRASLARAKYLEQEHQRQAQQRKEAMEASLRQDLEEKLRFALANLHDESLRKRIEECLNARSHDLDGVRQICEEVQEAAGHKTPEERLALLLESITPYCTEDELNACREEALRIFTNSGFREARNYAVAMHDQFRLRMRIIEEDEAKTETDIRTGQ
jgi:hypothetical protein